MKKTQVSLLPEEGREIRVNKSGLSSCVSISKSYVTSLLDATASCSRVIFKDNYIRNSGGKSRRGEVSLKLAGNKREARGENGHL